MAHRYSLEWESEFPVTTQSAHCSALKAAGYQRCHLSPYLPSLAVNLICKEQQSYVSRPGTDICSCLNNEHHVSQQSLCWSENLAKLIFTFPQVTQVWWASTRHTCGRCIRRSSGDIQCGLWAMPDTVCLQKPMIWLKVGYFPLYILYTAKSTCGHLLSNYSDLAISAYAITNLVYKIQHTVTVQSFWRWSDHLEWSEVAHIENKEGKSCKWLTYDLSQFWVVHGLQSSLSYLKVNSACQPVQMWTILHISVCRWSKKCFFSFKHFLKLFCVYIIVKEMIIEWSAETVCCPLTQHDVITSVINETVDGSR